MFEILDLRTLDLGSVDRDHALGDLNDIAGERDYAFDIVIARVWWSLEHHNVAGFRRIG